MKRFLGCWALGGYLLGGCSAGKSSTNVSGTGGTTVVPPVGACDRLPAPGTWENVTPPGMSMKPAVNGTVGAAIIVDPFDPRKVWLGTGSENDEIWRSDDCGATWTRVNTGPGGVGDNKTYGGVGDGAQWSMQADPVTPGVLYAVSGYGAQGLWKTTDGGHSWTDILAGTEQVFAADQWKPSLRSANLEDDQKWSDLPTPPQIKMGSDGGIPFLAYDDAHHVLYASMFSGGVARMVVP